MEKRDIQGRVIHREVLLPGATAHLPVLIRHRAGVIQGAAPLPQDMLPLKEATLQEVLPPGATALLLAQRPAVLPALVPPLGAERGKNKPG